MKISTEDFTPEKVKTMLADARAQIIQEDPSIDGMNDFIISRDSSFSFPPDRLNRLEYIFVSIRTSSHPPLCMFS